SISRAYLKALAGFQLDLFDRFAIRAAVLDFDERLRMGGPIMHPGGDGVVDRLKVIRLVSRPLLANVIMLSFQRRPQRTIIFSATNIGTEGVVARHPHVRFFAVIGQRDTTETRIDGYLSSLRAVSPIAQIRSDDMLQRHRMIEIA